MTIEHREKIGIGIWEKDANGSALDDVDRAGFAWHYSWNEANLWDNDTTPERSSFVSMAWGEKDAAAESLELIKSSGATTLLGFNEPDEWAQANMSAARALQLWSQLEATGLRVGSPAVASNQALGTQSWLGQFMAGAEAKDLQVDFIAVHYYSTSKDVGAFKTFLEKVHQQYDRPVWVTEWALADWSDPGRFSVNEQAAYARAGTEMMDDLAFVERHAWFAGYEGGDGWYLNSGIFNADGSLSPVGKVFAGFNASAPSSMGTSGEDWLQGGAGADHLQGFGGNDALEGKAGNDTLDGGAGVDRMIGSLGDDTYLVSDAGDVVIELKAEGYDVVVASVSHTLAAGIEELRLTGTAGLKVSGNDLASLIVGNGGNNWINGGAGADRMVGGKGHENYIVDSAGDVVSEAAYEGYDWVRALVSHALAENLEALELRGSADLWGTGNEAGNRIHANSGANVLKGLGGNDTIYARDGHDTLRGGTGNDLLDGGAGNDILNGEAGSDRLRGGAGADTFVITSASGTDTILDLDAQDTIRTSGFMGVDDFRDLSITTTGSTTRVSFTGGALLLASLAQPLTADDFLFG